MRRLFHFGRAGQMRGRLRKLGRFLAPLTFVLVLLLVTSPTTGAEVSRSPAAAVPTPTDTPIAAQEQDAVAYQINPAHTGATASATLNPPLVQRWSVNLGGTASYPIIAQGKVFVVVPAPWTPGSSSSVLLYALDAQNGQSVWGPKVIGSLEGVAALAYDAGNLFVYSDSSTLQSLDANTGVVHWTDTFATDWDDAGLPVASQGIVYVVGNDGADGTLFAVDEQSGRTLWTNNVPTGYNSAPTLSDDGVFLTFNLACTYKFDRWDGQLRWSTSSLCGMAPGRTPAYYQGRVYTHPPDSVGEAYNAETGNYVASFPAGPIPVLAGGYGFTFGDDALTASKLSAINLTTGVTRWTFSGDGQLGSAPIIVNQQVYVGSGTGNLYVLDAVSGQVLQTLNLGSPIPSPSPNDDPYLIQSSLNAGDGLLVVPTYQQLFAFGGTLPSGQATPVSRKGR